MKNLRIYSIVIIVMIFSAWACSELDDNIVPPPDVTVHDSEFAQQGSENHHSLKIKELNWDITSCRQCHAADYSGGLAQKSCLTGCHTETNGPEACNTCHGAFDDQTEIEPPDDLAGNSTPDKLGVGAHVLHRRTKHFREIIPCNECHIVPTAYSAAGHIDSTTHAEVTFGTLAETGGAVPVYNPSTFNCDNVYCHGGFSFDKSSAGYAAFAYSSAKIEGENPTFNWTSGNTAAQCGSCHTLPPKGHIYASEDMCRLCHADVVDVNAEIIGTDQHINGMKNVISEEDLNKCNFCHGDANASPSDTTKAAPPRALNGSTDPTYRGVGAHAKHLTASSFTLNVQCGECHNVPKTYSAPGHFAATEHAEINFGERKGASQAGTAPSFDATAVTCSNGYCHGDFRNGNADNVVTWTGGSDEAKCGTCHGDPTTGNPLPGGTHFQVPDCSVCHSTVVSVNGDVYTIIDSTKHINGKINVFGGEQDF